MTAKFEAANQRELTCACGSRSVNYRLINFIRVGKIDEVRHALDFVLRCGKNLS